MGRVRLKPPSYRCRNPRCRSVEYGFGPLCPSCRVAGTWGAVAAFMVGALLKLAGVI